MSVPIELKRKRRQKEVVSKRQTRNRINSEMQSYSTQAKVTISEANPVTSAATVLNYLDHVDAIVDPVVCLNASKENTCHISVMSAGTVQIHYESLS